MTSDDTRYEICMHYLNSYNGDVFDDALDIKAVDECMKKFSVKKEIAVKFGEFSEIAKWLPSYVNGLKEEIKSLKRDLHRKAERSSTPEETVETKSPGKNNDPSAKALRKLLRKRGEDTTGYDFDTVTYEKALLLTGDTKPIKDVLKELGGKWNSGKKGWIFSKKSLLKQTSP